jgi:hypothetical protein
MLSRSFHPGALALAAGGVVLVGIVGGMLAVALGL